LTGSIEVVRTVYGNFPHCTLIWVTPPTRWSAGRAGSARLSEPSAPMARMVWSPICALARVASPEAPLTIT